VKMKLLQRREERGVMLLNSFNPLAGAESRLLTEHDSRARSNEKNTFSIFVFN
jgi:hypothetical protein